MKKLGKILSANAMLLINLVTALFITVIFIDMIRTRSYIWIYRLAVIILFNNSSGIPFLRNIKTGKGGLVWLLVATLFAGEMVLNIFLENSFRVVLCGLATAWFVWVHFKYLRKYPIN